jgi:hypothetical protein
LSPSPTADQIADYRDNFLAEITSDEEKDRGTVRLYPGSNHGDWTTKYSCTNPTQIDLSCIENGLKEIELGNESFGNSHGGTILHMKRMRDLSKMGKDEGHSKGKVRLVKDERAE